MAKPITDPLRVDPQEDPDEIDLHDPQHDDINTGAPARNYKMWGMALAAFGIAGMLLLPSKSLVGHGPPAGSVRGPEDQKPGTAVVDALKDEANDARRRATNNRGGIDEPPGGTRLDPNVGRTNATPSDYVTGGQPGIGPNAQARMTAEEEARARREAILSSPMEATGVALQTGRGTGSSRPGSIDADADDKRRELLEMQTKMFDSLGKLGGGGDARAAGRNNADQDFLGRAATKGIEPALQMTAARSGPTLYEGTIVRTVLDKAINTDLPGSIRAHVVSDVYDSVFGTRLLIPRGSVVTGQYSSGLVVGQDRVLVALTRLRLPNGKSVSLLGAPADDSQGVAGLSADIDNHFIRMFGSSLMVGAASLLLPKAQQSVTVNVGAGGTQTGGTVLATSLQETVKAITERNRNIKPTGTVDLGEPFTFMISRDIAMDEYRKGAP
jgi:type IV secretion system protein VirB10